MHNRFLIAIDSGKNTTKGVMKEEGTLLRIKFRTKVEAVSDFGAEIAPNSFLVEFEGKSFLIGEMVGEDRTNFDLTKHTKEHLLCIYLAITQLLLKSRQSKGIADISLAINIPLSLYKNEKHKNAYFDFIRNGSQAIYIKVNGKSFVFRINQLLLLPEGIGPIYSDINQYRNKRALVVDIGSLNINYLEFNHLVPQYDKMITTDHGVNILRSKLADTLTSKYGTTISDNDVEQLFRDKCLYLNGEKQEDSKEIIEGLIANHVKEIFNHARSRKLTFNNTEMIFVGGGSLLLRDYILMQFPAALIHSDPQFANVLSFLKILEAKQYGQTA